MSSDPPDFEGWFKRTLGRAPYPWQATLGSDTAPTHRLLRVPTGFGKTLGVAASWLFNRVVRGDDRWPRRLVWALPMRTLVDQTASECRRLLASAGAAVDVHVLMGGADAGEYHLAPERPAILVGTQDMLLSRALNRGYGAARARWPMEFGLLSQDTLWVLDEVQLMGVGFATALQLAAFRLESAALRPTFTWAMSATLQRQWITRSPDTTALAARMPQAGLGASDRALPLWGETSKRVRRLPPVPGAALPAALATEVGRALETEGGVRQVLVVCNTVDRARSTFDAVRRQVPAARADLHLIHSRFRGAERARWGEILGPVTGALPRVIVATQVVEAGVDLSADVLITEVCPWASLVQRVGRLARRGGNGVAVVQGLEEREKGAPYDADDVTAAWDALQGIDDVSPRSLDAFEAAAPPGLITALYPFEPAHILLREEIDDLFDTTTDLSGGDLDISRFIREGDERDLSVAWVSVAKDERGRAIPPAANLRPSRDALCAVPFLVARDWLCGKKTGGSEPKRLRAGVHAYVWDYLQGRWRIAARADLRPGAEVLIDASVGGYDTIRGFDAGSGEPVAVIPLLEASAQDRADASDPHDDLSQAAWQTIGFHGGAVAADVARIVAVLSLAEHHPAFATALDIAARWHDVGKAHPAFQGAIRSADRPARNDLAKAPAAAWGSGRDLFRIGGEARPGFRHELASTLALFDVLLRHAPPEHPARLGAWASAFSADNPRSSEAPDTLEQEVLNLPPELFDLVAFLVCAHHGKLRARLHASPADQDAARGADMPIRGVHEGDELPAVMLRDAGGADAPLPVSRLTLEPAVLGLSPRTGRSWTERVDALRTRYGPFALAWLECLLRAADIRASRDRTLADPALLEVSS